MGQTEPSNPVQPPRITPDLFMAKLMELSMPGGLADFQRSIDRFTADARNLLTIADAINKMTAALQDASKAMRELNETLK